MFYLAVLPQFLTPGAGLGWLLVLAWSHAVLSLSYLLVLVTGLHGARRLLMRRKVRRGLDATTGAVLLGFSAKLATAARLSASAVGQARSALMVLICAYLAGHNAVCC